jgi:hypothetical protein
MRNYFYSLFILGLLTTCSDSDSKDSVNYKGIEAEIPEEDVFDYDTLQGMYIGDFGGSDIRIVLNYVSKTNAIGYNIHKGLQRNLSGKVKRSGDSVTVYMAEPGDHEFDGVFELLFIGENPTPKGTWKSNSGIISPKKFSLHRVQPDEGKNWQGNEKITFENLHLFFSEASDTLGDYSFKSDGLVIFTYYPGGYWSDDEETDAVRSKKQMTEILGTWAMKGNKVTISWAQNRVFPYPEMRYEVRQSDYEAELYRDGNPIYMRMYP